jgi:hypothetical protein
MLDYSRKAVAMIEGCVRQDLDRDEMLSLALTRAVEIIGEAATRVSQSSRMSRPDPLSSFSPDTMHLEGFARRTRCLTEGVKADSAQSRVVRCKYGTCQHHQPQKTE